MAPSFHSLYMGLPPGWNEVGDASLMPPILLELLEKPCSRVPEPRTCELRPLKKLYRDFSGGPVVKTLCFQFRVYRFYPWSGNSDSINIHWCMAKKEKYSKKKKALLFADQLFKSQPPANVKWVKFLQGRNRPISLFCTFILLLV